MQASANDRLSHYARQGKRVRQIQNSARNVRQFRRPMHDILLRINNVGLSRWELVSCI